MEGQGGDDLRRACRMVVIIGIAIIASMAVYAALAQLLKQGGNLSAPMMPLEQMNILRCSFYGLSILVILAIAALKRMLLSDKAIAQIGQSRKSSYPAPLQALVTSTIITYALCESVAVFGLVLFFLTRTTRDFYILLAVSLILFAVNFPRLSQWQDRLAQRETPQAITQGKI